MSYGEVLARRAEATPAATAFVFLEEDGSERALSYAELHRRASGIAAVIEARRREAAELVLLLFAPGLDYIAALFGCFYAGAPAVPAYPPIPTRISRTLPRLLGILEDSAADLVLTTGVLREAVEQWVQSARGPVTPRVVATDEDVPDGAAPRGAIDVTTDALALLQYTSGSTAAPRGVMLTHEHLLSNSERIRTAFGATPDDRRRDLAAAVPRHGAHRRHPAAAVRGGRRAR